MAESSTLQTEKPGPSLAVMHDTLKSILDRSFCYNGLTGSENWIRITHEQWEILEALRLRVERAVNDR